MAGRSLAPLVAILILFAGCAAKSEPAPSTDDQAFKDLAVAATTTTGVIRGIVVDEAIRPMLGVEVTVQSQGKTMHSNSTASGAFGFQGLTPGTYFVKSHKLGYHDTQSSVEVQAGVSDPPATKILIKADPGSRPYYSVQSFRGFIQCTSSVVAICGAPNVVSNVLLCPAFGVCQGNLTDDRFGWNFFYEPNATMIQSELVWSSTQSLSTQLTMEMENLGDCKADGDAYIEDTVGDSPIYNIANETEVAKGTIGGTCPIWHSLFSGATAGTPAGVTVQQDFRAFSHSFYHFTPPEGWRFSKDGDPKVPA